MEAVKPRSDQDCAASTVTSIAQRPGAVTFALRSLPFFYRTSRRRDQEYRKMNA